MAKKAKTKKKEKPTFKQTDLPTHTNSPSLHPETANEATEEMSEAEADAIVEEAAAKEKARMKKLESEMDSQDWSLSDPVIPEALKADVWIAVFKCALGHKTKATNRQAKTGVRCWRCKEDGKTAKADIMLQFLVPPETGDPDIDKRRRARKGNQ